MSKKRNRISVLVGVFMAIALSAPALAGTPECDADRTCWGRANDLFARVLVQESVVRLVMKPGIVKDRLAEYGCGENWTIYLHNEKANRDAFLNQLIVAETLDKTIWLVFMVHGGHCDIDLMYRGVGHNPGG